MVGWILFIFSSYIVGAVITCMLCKHYYFCTYGRHDRDLTCLGLLLVTVWFVSPLIFFGMLLSKGLTHIIDSIILNRKISKTKKEIEKRELENHLRELEYELARMS